MLGFSNLSQRLKIKFSQLNKINRDGYNFVSIGILAVVITIIFIIITKKRVFLELRSAKGRKVTRWNNKNV